jgi:hypothetical protein
LSEAFEQEALRIDKLWEEILKELAKRNKCLKMVIFAEAPLSFDRYFYNRPGNFLSGLKAYYSQTLGVNLDNGNFIDFLNNRGVVIVDMYRFPFPSRFYKLYHNLFFDPKYLDDKIQKLKTMLCTDTKFTFRYKMLRERGIQNTAPFASHQHRFIFVNSEVQTIFSQERPRQIVNQHVAPYL